MENLGSKCRVFAILFALLWLVACDPLDDSLEVTDPIFRVDLVDDVQCKLQVTLSRPGVDETMLVHLQDGAGISIQDTNKQSIEMFANDTRYPSFLCDLSSDELVLPGQYVLWAIAYRQDGQPHQEAYTLLNIGETRGEFTLHRDPKLAQPNSQSFVQGDSNFAYLFVVDEARPTIGTFFVKAISQQNAYAPRVEISVKGDGVIFDAPASSAIRQLSASRIEVQFPRMNHGGSRIASLPVRMIDEASAGTYGIEARIVEDGVARCEMAASAIKISAENEYLQLSATNYPSSCQAAQPTAVPELPQQRAGKLAPVTTAPEVSWTARLSNFSGTRQQAFDLLIPYGFTDDEFAWFEQTVGQHNPDLEKDNWEFKQEKTYLLPIKTDLAP